MGLFGHLKDILLASYLSIFLFGCTTTKQFSIIVTSEQEKKLWVDKVAFRDYSRSVGTIANTGRAGISFPPIEVPDEISISWQKQAHYTEYKNLPVYERTVKIPKPLPELKDKEYGYNFVLNILKNNEVELIIENK